MTKLLTKTLTSCDDCPYYSWISIDCVAHVRCTAPNGPGTMPGDGKDSISPMGEIPPDCPLPDAPTPTKDPK